MKPISAGKQRRGVHPTVRFAACAAAALAAACSDSSEGVVEAGAPREVPAAAVAPAYSTVIGEDWTKYATIDQLKAAGLFYWQGVGDVFNHVALVPDATFGQVVRVRFPQNSGDIGQAPRMGRDVPQPMGKMWFRWRMKWTPGWTTVGPDPAGAGNSYKMVFWTWAGYNGRANVLLANTDDYVGEWFVANAQGQKISFSETMLPGSAANFGEVGTEWQDNQWYEFVAYYETTSATSGKQHWWRRRLTENGQLASNPWVYYGMGFSGNTMPRVNGVQLGVNKNKNNPTDMYLSWGPWEVVDGSVYPNPWNMPNVAGGTPTPAPALARVVMTPDTARLAPGAAAQFQAYGRMSDGTTQPVAVTYTATGGTVTTAGAYTAPAATGSYRVVATQQGGTLADTSTVIVAASTTPTLSAVVLTPATLALQPGGQAQLQASGRYSDGSTRAVAVTYTATGGTITTAGLYTAGSATGAFRVIATAQGSTRADTSAVTISAPAPTPPPPAGSYTRLVGEDWRGYTSTGQLQGFTDVAQVALVADPTFGQVVRITQPAGTLTSPRMARTLASSRDRVWLRWRMKFSPGWTNGGTYGLGGLRWAAHGGDNYLNFTSSSYNVRFSVRSASGTVVGFTETQLAGSRPLGAAATEWSDGQWYEYVSYYEKTGATTARQHYWRRRLTSGGQVVSSAWVYQGFAISGATTPQVGAVQVGLGRTRASSATQQVYVGPWEAVDGTQFANPFGMPNL